MTMINAVLLNGSQYIVSLGLLALAWASSREMVHDSNSTSFKYHGLKGNPLITRGGLHDVNSQVSSVLCGMVLLLSVSQCCCAGP